MRTVLVVEDSLSDREIISHYLQQAGMSVMIARSGEEALEKLTHQVPNLIILDVVLGGRSGFEICRDIKTDPKTRSIPVVISSTKGTEADKMLGSMLGADAYLPKPVNQSELVKTIERLIR